MVRLQLMVVISCAGLALVAVGIRPAASPADEVVKNPRRVIGVLAFMNVLLDQKGEHMIVHYSQMKRADKVRDGAELLSCIDTPR